MNAALETWREKLQFLLKAEATAIDAAEKFKIRNDISEARSRVEELQKLEQPTSMVNWLCPRIDISHIARLAPAKLVGRTDEIRALSEVWQRTENENLPRIHVLIFVAFGGQGKTSLVAKWAIDLAINNVTGCETAFAWSFYRQGTSQEKEVSSDEFLTRALTFFGDSATAGSAQSARDKGSRLAELVGTRRALLILDGLEPLQHAPTSTTPGKINDPGIAALLLGLATRSRGLCVVTTRYSVVDLLGYGESTVDERKLRSLTEDAGLALLRAFDVKGEDEEIKVLVRKVLGHALTLKLLGSYLRAAHGGNIRKSNTIRFDEVVYGEQGQASRVMDAYVLWFESGDANAKDTVAALRLLGLFSRPATFGCLWAIMDKPAIRGLTDSLVSLRENQRMLVLARLASADLVVVDHSIGSVDSHPLIREYFTVKLRRLRTWKRANLRLAQYHERLPVDPNPRSQADIVQLLQAVEFYAKAGRSQAAVELLTNRALHGQAFYPLREFGMMGEVRTACLAVLECWNPEAGDNSKAFILQQLSYCSRGLGLITEAGRDFRRALDLYVKVENFVGAAETAGLLAITLMLQGELDEGLTAATNGLDCAQKAKSASKIMYALSTVGSLHFYRGDIPSALTNLEEAKRLLLLGGEYLSVSSNCANVRSRLAEVLIAKRQFKKAEKITKDGLKIAERDKPGPAYVAFLQVACARALMGLDLKRERRDTVRTLLEHALVGFKIGSLRHETVRAYLAWTEFHVLYGSSELAIGTLKDAWEIAEPSSMRLYMADIHLFRCRIFLNSSPSSLGEAEREFAAADQLIKSHGYGRRSKELAVLEAEMTANKKEKS